MSVKSRRVLAIVVDGLLFTPIWVLASFYDFGIALMVVALELVYFYLCDVTSGQTVGKALFKLRTVTLEGQIVSGRPAAGRTVLRLIDHGLIGLISIMVTKRHQRLGDLAAGTHVVDAREVVVSRPLEGSMIGYPLAWLVPALVVFGLTATGHFPGSYRVEADAICEEADAIAPTLSDPEQLVQLTRAETAELRRLDAPLNWRDRHEVLVAEYTTLGNKLHRALRRTNRSATPSATWQREWARLVQRAEQSNARLAELGYKGCAGEGASA